MGYIAVVKRDPPNELQHWKYIKRKKVNGKWRYYYEEGDLRRYEDRRRNRIISKNGDTTIIREKRYEQTDDLFDNQGKAHAFTSDKEEFIDIYQQGKLSRVVAKAEKWIYDKVYDQNNKRSLSSVTEATINKGKKKVANFLRDVADKID